MKNEGVWNLSRRRKDRYRLKVGGLKIEISLLSDFCETSTDFQIAEEILIIHRFWNTLEFLRGGGDFELKLLRKSKVVKQ